MIRLPLSYWRRPSFAAEFLIVLALLGSLASPTFAEPGRTVFDVTDFGASPNDGSPDNLGVNLAIAAAAANVGGGIVHFPCGIYTSSPTFWRGVFRINTGQNNIWIRGENSNCVTFEVNPAVSGGSVLGSICPSTGTFGCPVDGPVPENIWVSGIRFWDPDSSAHAGNEQTHGLIAKCKNCRYFDIRMDGLGDEAFDITDSDNVTIERSTCERPGVSGAGANAGGCINIQTSRDIAIRDFQCFNGTASPATNPGSWCVRLESFFAGIPIERVTIERLRVTNFSGGGVQVTSPLAPVVDFVVRDSHIETAGFGRFAIHLTGSARKSGVRITDNRLSGGIKMDYVDDPIISGNHIDAATAAGIEFNNVRDAIISNNSIRDARLQCIMVRAAGSTSILGNRCLGTGRFSRNVIEIQDGFFKGGSIVIANNIIDAHPHAGIGILANVPGGELVTVRGNTIEGTNTRGILAQGVIDGNLIRDAGTEGIYLQGSNATGSRVVNNIIENTGGACIGGSGAVSVRISGNRTESCGFGDINLSSNAGNHHVTVTDNDTEGSIIADGISSVCMGNRSDMMIDCGGNRSTVIGNIVPQSSFVDGTGISSQEQGNVE